MCCSCWLSVGVMTLHLHVTCMQSYQHVLPVMGPCGQVCAQPQDCVAFYLLITTTMEIKSIKVLCNEFQFMTLHGQSHSSTCECSRQQARQRSRCTQRDEQNGRQKGTCRDEQHSTRNGTQ